MFSNPHRNFTISAEVLRRQQLHRLEKHHLVPPAERYQALSGELLHRQAPLRLQERDVSLRRGKHMVDFDSWSNCRIARVKEIRSRIGGLYHCCCYFHRAATRS